MTSFPSLVIVGADGTPVNLDALEEVAADPEGHRFPWPPNPVLSVDSERARHALDRNPTLIVFCETCCADTQREMELALGRVAKKVNDRAKLSVIASEANTEIAFVLATSSDGMAPHLRTMFGLRAAASGKPEPIVVLCDIMDNGGFYLGPMVASRQSIAKFIKKFQKKKLVHMRKQLES